MNPLEGKTNALVFVGFDTENVERTVMQSFITRSYFEQIGLRKTEALGQRLNGDYSERYSRIIVLYFEPISAQTVNELLEIGKKKFELFALLCDQPLLEAEESRNKVYLDILTNNLDSKSGPFDWRGYYLVAPPKDWVGRPKGRGFVETYVGMNGPSIKFLESWSKEGSFVVCGELEPTAPSLPHPTRHTQPT